MTHPFTPTYIAMAKAAEEIQAMRPDQHHQDAWHPPHPAMGSIFAKPYKDGWEFRAFAWLDEAELWQVAANFHESADEFIWLARMDQLLGMLGSFDPVFLERMAPVEWAGAEHDFEGMEAVYKPQSEYADYLRSFKSYEELALAVVMQLKFGKRWRDGKWEKV